MESVGAEVSQKIRSAIKAKLMEIGVYVDEELPDYVMVMVANKRSKEQMDDELQLFLGKHTSLFTTWLHQVLQKLQEVTVANLGGLKRKLTDDSKKKKKNKQDSERKELKKKIKVEPEDDDKIFSKMKEAEKEKKNTLNEDIESITSDKRTEIIEPKKKEKSDSRMFIELVTKNISKVNKQLADLNTENQHTTNLDHRAARGKSRSISSQAEDADDEDCINIRTDGELLDTAEEANTEETSKKSMSRKDSTDNSDKDIDKKRKSYNRSPVRQKSKSPVIQKIKSPVRQKSISPVRQKSKSPVRQKSQLKSIDYRNTDRYCHRSTHKKQISSDESPPRTTDKVFDARDLLNRKKAAKQSENRSRTRSRERSVSPSHKRREDDRDRVYHDDRGGNRRSIREDERESSSGRVRNGRDGRSTQDRDSYSSKRREDHSRRSDSERIASRRREPSDEPSPKRVMLEKPFRNKKEDRDFSRSSKLSGIVEGRKLDMEASGRRRELEESRKRGIVSHVVTRPQEPEESVETPVPSVVKITPRPRRPPSQQPSSTLIMKAISEANKSLASVPQRPDSTQRGRKEAGFTRTLHRERIPPTIAVSITNPFAVNNGMESEEEGDKTPSPCPDDSARNRSPPPYILEYSPSPESENIQSDINSKETRNKKGKQKENFQAEEIQEPVLELEELAPDLLDFEEPVDEMSDPHFVVTLSGYDPDGLFSPSDMDAADELERNDWIKENDEDPLQTSTPVTESPRFKRERRSSPIVIVNTPTPSVNHNNLIEVKPKSSERCKYWPACRLADKCIYYHPSKPCKLFPSCKFGDSCLYIHPQCKYNTSCKRDDCVFAHTPAHTPLQPAVVPKAKALYAACAPQLCKFYPNCTNINCQFTHPARACRYGLYCNKKDCLFDHGKIAPVDKLKWTRVTST